MGYIQNFGNSRFYRRSLNNRVLNNPGIEQPAGPDIRRKRAGKPKKIQRNSSASLKPPHQSFDVQHLSGPTSKQNSLVTSCGNYTFTKASPAPDTGLHSRHRLRSEGKQAQRGRGKRIPRVPHTEQCTARCVTLARRRFRSNQQIAGGTTEPCARYTAAGAERERERADLAAEGRITVTSQLSAGRYLSHV